MGLPPGVGYRWRSCYPWKGSRDAIWVLEPNFLPSLASQFLYTVPDLPCVRSTMPVSSRGPRRRRSWLCHMALVNPQHLHACEAGGVIRCGLQIRLDMGPHGIPRGCQLSSQA